jgi:hypothetical protein
MKNLTERHGEKADEVFRELADLGGFGEVGDGQGQVSPHYAGGLGILGALREENTAVSPQAKDRIAELCGVDRKQDVDNHQGVGLARNETKDPKEK